MQALDISFCKSLKNFYNQEVQCWFCRHHGRPVTDYQIAELFGIATIANALSGLRKTGIIPLNSDIFSEEDFVAASVTERTAPASTQSDMVGYQD